MRLLEECSSNSSSTSVKLLKIHIVPFDSKIEHCVSFIEIFVSLIYCKNCPALEKLHHLLSSVSGHAFDLIKNYPQCDENYLMAYNTLKAHYNKKEL